MKRIISDDFDCIISCNGAQSPELIKCNVNLFNYPLGIPAAGLRANATITSIPFGGSAPMCILRADGNLHGNIKREAGKFIPLDFNFPDMLNIHIDSVGGDALPVEMVIIEGAVEMMGLSPVIQLDAAGS